MSNDLDPIIRRIERRAAARPGRVAVAIHPKTGKALSDEGVLKHFNDMRSDVVWYEVTVDEPHRVDNEKTPIEVFHTNERTSIAYRVRVSAGREKARAIAEALHHSEMTPVQVLFRTIDTYVERLLEKPDNLGPESVAERLSISGASWQAELERFIGDRLHLDARIIFQTDPLVETDIKLRVENVKVSPMDAPHASFPITVSVVFARAAQARGSDYLPRRKEDRELLVANVVGKTFRDKLSLYTYWFEPERVQRELTAALAENLARFAYNVKRLSIDPIVPPVASEEQIYDNVGWKGRLEREVPFHIATKIRMTPEGAGIYHARNLPNRKVWINAEVKEALQAAMYGRDFINLTADAEGAVRARVEEVLRAKARSIGHDVETFVAKALIPEQIWFSPTTVKVGRRTYNTKNDLVPAEFEIDLVVQFASLERLEPLIQAHRLNRPNDLQDGANAAIRSEIIASAVRAAEREMSQTEPSAYFSEYERWDLPGNENGQPVREVRNQLVRAISKELEGDFEIASCRVDLRRVDSRVQDVIKQLQGIGDFSVHVEIEPQHSEGPHQSILVKITYHIGGLVPARVADVIQRGEAALNASLMRRDLENWSREALGERSTAELYGLASRRADNRVVRQEVENYVAALMAEHHGVTVHIKWTDFVHSQTDQFARGAAALTIEQKMALLKKAREAVNEISEQNDDKARTAFLRDRINILRRMINENPRKEAEDFDALRLHEKELERMNDELNRAHAVIAQTPLAQLTHLERPAPAPDGPREASLPDATDPGL
jgi:hypothetical protein